MAGAQIGGATVSGGASSVLAGGNFWDGARQGFITAALNHVAHSLTDPPGKRKVLQQHREEAVTLKEWVEAYKGFSQEDIALERGKDNYGLPLGPSAKYRYVINPYDDNVMDMRHVVVVGYGMGETAGLGAELIQKIAGFFGKDPTNSAFNLQDKYSNNIGAAFFSYDYRNYGIYMGYDFARRFNNFLYKTYNR